ncbi:MAG: hypothetical protein LBM98_13505 [Oscillospiraceae bacterium]|nr:hypothetical protein [Oscillospiraceae bacterium]
MRYVGRLGARQSSAGSVTYGRIAGLYVNPGLLCRITIVRIASAVAASQRRAGLRPALSRRIAPGRWTGLRPRTARGGRV